MSADPARTPPAYLEVQGAAADHLYREGSARASFWEALFGSSLRAKKRTRVSALPDGTRVFDVPLFEVEQEILGRARVWMTSEAGAGTCGETAALIASKKVRLRLVGLQPRGQAQASFSLRFEPDPPGTVADPAGPGAFRSWFDACGSSLARETLIPFGFTPKL